MRGPSIVWFRQDLRLRDHAPLLAAGAREGAIIPVFVCEPAGGAWSAGAASRWWLHHSLTALDRSLRGLGSRLVIRRGPAARVLRELARETGAGSVFAQALVEPAAAARDEAVERALGEVGCAFERLDGALLVAPGVVTTRAGGPYRVFTPFWRALLAGPQPPAPRAAPRALRAPRSWPASDALASCDLLPTTSWDAGLAAEWTPGESGGLARLRAFATAAAHGRYEKRRDEPGVEGTSRLSPHLHWGEVSVREAWHAIASRGGAGHDAWLRQIVWREFAQHALHHFPDAPDAPLRPEFARFPWRRDARALRAWQQGRTGYPIVDAGMRELWATGWMHNRVRMIVASFLVKHLLLPWQEGERWFWDTLVDADLANNALSWQWVAGCGFDASPWFRIFNPVVQGRKFDARGAYVRRWVPEIAALPDRALHAPWSASDAVLSAAGVRLGRVYPHPIVDHAFARQRALAALHSARRA